MTCLLFEGDELPGKELIPIRGTLKKAKRRGQVTPNRGF